MRSNLLQASIALALLAGVSGANAQGSQPPQSLSTPEQNSAAERALQTPSGKAGKDEPGSHATNDSVGDANAVFVNGKLNVSGAPHDGPTVPSKFSEKNAAADKLIILAHTFVNLPDDQRAGIYQALKDEKAASVSKAEIGTELPASTELRGVPLTVAQQFPAVKDYDYVLSDRGVLIVYGPARVVVGMIQPGAAANTVGAGSGAQ
jgi:hypothetical protein